MSKIAHIKRRIKSVKNTRQITKAMQLVAASKMKRAQDRALAGRDYALLLARMMHVAISHSDEVRHPMMERREVKTRGILTITTDKGLCGALNANLYRLLSQIQGDCKFVNVGRKGKQYLSRTGRNLVADFQVSDKAQYAEVRPIVEFMVKAFLDGEIDTVEIAFPRFINTMVQEPRLIKILPIVDLQDCLDQLRLKDEEDTLEMTHDDREIKYEPDVASILEELPILFVKQQIHQFILSAKASEHSARMVAMKSATDNASTLVDSLTLKFNKARQAAITQEILEIAAATASNSGK
ncbi:MAG: ATP synthase F1 subunit gamma [Puniceicoccaceae bacterium]